MFIFTIIPVAIVIGVAVFISRAVKLNKQNEADKQATPSQSSGSSTKSSKVGLTDEQRRRLDYLREKYMVVSEVDKHERHQQDAHDHGHTGEEEHYEEIVGSLGEVNDEGCEDLSGVRFIAHDLAYDTSENGQDYTQLAKAMVLGEIINNPRFKSPYTKK